MVISRILTLVLGPSFYSQQMNQSVSLQLLFLEKESYNLQSKQADTYFITYLSYVIAAFCQAVQMFAHSLFEKVYWLDFEVFILWQCGSRSQSSGSERTLS